MVGSIPSEYYTASKKIAQVYEKDGGYWDSNVELTARAFAPYMMDKLPQQSDYLVGHAENVVALVPTKDGTDMEVVGHTKSLRRLAVIIMAASIMLKRPKSFMRL